MGLGMRQARFCVSSLWDFFIRVRYLEVVVAPQQSFYFDIQCSSISILQDDSVSWPCERPFCLMSLE